MEPRPQRPRNMPGHPGGHPGGQPAQPSTPSGGVPGAPEGVDPATFIAPSRTDYDYSPLDLAPSGQRRRRQFVAAAVGGLVVLLIATLAFLGFLLFRDDNPTDGDAQLAARQTEVAMREATLDAEQTAVAGSGDQTPTAEDAAGETPTTPPGGATETPPSDATQPADAPTEPAEATTAASGSGSGPTSEELAALLPPESEAPAGLDTLVDNELDFDGVVEALGGSRPARANLEEWGWSGNAARQFNPSDPEAVDPEGLSVLTVSIHGFATSQAAAEALPFFSDILANNGYEEVDAPKVGDRARMLTIAQEDGSTEIALYVQAGQLLYRVTGVSAAGDPTETVTSIMSGMLDAAARAGHGVPLALATRERRL